MSFVDAGVEHRGKDPEQEAVWPVIELQSLLDEWLVVWNNRPHAGLADPVTPDRALSPNEKYAALTEVAGCGPVPLSADDYAELLPVAWHAINKYGVRRGKRTYDCKALNPCRRQHSGIENRNSRWEAHYVTRLWGRNHHDGGRATVPWKHLSSAPVPFGELAWRHAREILARRGRDTAAEAEITQAAAGLLDREGRAAYPDVIAAAESLLGSP